MTDIKISSKMHLFIIITAIVVAIGLAVGLACHFTGFGYFNYGADYKSYDSIVVSYAYVEYSDSDDVKSVCEEILSEEGISAYSVTVNDGVGQGGEVVYSFPAGTDSSKIESAAEKLNAKLQSDAISMSNAYYHSAEALLGGGQSLMYGAIALASAVVLQFLYFVIRFRLTMAFSALLADAHNLAVFLSLLAITRLPVGSYVFALSILTVVVTMIGCIVLFDRARKNIKSDEGSKLTSWELADKSAAESLIPCMIVAGAAAVCGILLFVFMSISALSLTLSICVSLGALVSALSCAYGTSFFVPSVYSRIKDIGDRYRAKHSRRPAKQEK